MLKKSKVVLLFILMVSIIFIPIFIFVKNDYEISIDKNNINKVKFETIQTNTSQNYKINTNNLLLSKDNSSIDKLLTEKIDNNLSQINSNKSTIIRPILFKATQDFDLKITNINTSIKQYTDALANIKCENDIYLNYQKAINNNLKIEGLINSTETSTSLKETLTSLKKDNQVIELSKINCNLSENVTTFIKSNINSNLEKLTENINILISDFDTDSVDNFNTSLEKFNLINKSYEQNCIQCDQIIGKINKIPEQQF